MRAPRGACRRRLRVLLVVAVLAASAAGCGFVGNDEAVGAGGTETPTAGLPAPSTVDEEEPTTSETLLPPTTVTTPVPTTTIVVEPPDEPLGFEVRDPDLGAVCDALLIVQQAFYDIYDLGTLDAYHSTARSVLDAVRVIEANVPVEMADGAAALTADFDAGFAPILAATTTDELGDAVAAFDASPLYTAAAAPEVQEWALGVCPSNADLVR